MHPRKQIRLRPENYQGRQSYFVTVCCDSRRTYLGKAEIAERVITLLRECAAHASFLLHAYCVMPDHLHFLAEGTSGEANLPEFVRVFKLRVTSGGIQFAGICAALRRSIPIPAR